MEKINKIEVTWTIWELPPIWGLPPSFGDKHITVTSQFILLETKSWWRVVECTYYAKKHYHHPRCCKIPSLAAIKTGIGKVSRAGLRSCQYVVTTVLGGDKNSPSWKKSVKSRLKGLKANESAVCGVPFCTMNYLTLDELVNKFQLTNNVPGLFEKAELMTNVSIVELC